MADTEKYIAFVEADAGITVEAENEDHAREQLENVRTGVANFCEIRHPLATFRRKVATHLGPPKVRSVELFYDDNE